METRLGLITRRPSREQGLLNEKKQLPSHSAVYVRPSLAVDKEEDSSQHRKNRQKDPQA